LSGLRGGGDRGARPAGAAAAITEFVIPTSGSGATGITVRANGALYFIGFYTNKIGWITTAGAITEFSIPTTASNPIDITAGPDGALWFTETNSIGRFVVEKNLFEFTDFVVPTRGGGPAGITAGPDGALWFVEYFGNKVGRITTAGIFSEIPIPTAGSEPTGITAGPDGALWFTETNANKIGRSTTPGVITEFVIPTPSSAPSRIAAGPDGALWFTEQQGGKIGRITTAGVITEFVIPTANSGPYGITAGPDGALWFVEQGGNKIGRITTAGVITEFSIPSAVNGLPTGITAGLDGALWFPESPANKIGRLQLPPTNSHDFNGDAKSDILFRNTGSPSSTVAMWLMNGGSILSSGSVATIPNSYSIIGQRDFDGDGDTDLLWRDTSGNLYMWFMNGLTISSSAALGNVPNTWTVMGTADMNGDGNGDILWQDSSGDVAIWFMNGSQISSSTILGTVPPSSNWSIVWATVGTILWKNTSADPYTYSVWLVNGSTTQSAGIGSVPSNWVVQGMGDFNGDGVPDILWRDSTAGTVAIWLLNSGGTVQSTATVNVVPTSSTWAINETGDYDGNGMSDILWVDGSGNVAIWFMNGATIASTANLGNVGTSWTVQAQSAE